MMKNLVALIFLGCMAVACVAELPASMDGETKNQRHIAAKSITPHGYNEYMQFVERNRIGD